MKNRFEQTRNKRHDLSLSRGQNMEVEITDW